MAKEKKLKVGEEVEVKKSPQDVAIEAAMKEVEKQFGKGSICILGNETPTAFTKTFSTGSMHLDKAIGIYGYPRGRIIEIFGQESSGKTTLTLHAIASVQKENGRVLFVDAEHALDLDYAKKLGVDTDNMILSQPDYGEQALEICETMIRSGGIDLVVVDSVAALVPKSELDGDMGGSSMGLQARLMSQAMRKLAGIVSTTNTTIIFINQLREKIGVMFGPSEVTTGGNALKFYASIRLRVAKKKAIKRGDEVIGNETQIKVIKNKMAPPFREANTEIYYGKGVWATAEALTLACDYGIMNMSGAWYQYKGENIGQGKVKTLDFLEANPQILKEIKDKVYIEFQK